MFNFWLNHEKRKAKRKERAARRKLGLSNCPERLEDRLMLFVNAMNDTYPISGGAPMNHDHAYISSTSVLANDMGTGLTATMVSGPSHGTVSLSSSGQFTYTPPYHFYGSTSFVYQATDGTSTSDATASLTVAETAPYISTASTYSVLHDNTLTVNAANGVLSHAIDNEGDSMTASLVTGPNHGTLTLNADGSFTYVPAPLWYGSDSFVADASDGILNSSGVTFDINVTDQAPFANNQAYTLTSGSTYNVSAANGALHGDSDPDGDAITAALVSSPAHGSLGLNSDGSFAYTPNSGWSGSDSFTYESYDGLKYSTTATVTLTTDYGIVSATDVTTLPLGTVQADNQILGTSAGTPATAQNLGLHYDSVTGHSDVVIEADVTMSTNVANSNALSAALTFNGTAQTTQYFSLNGLTGTSATTHLALQVDTSGLATGRYAYSLTINGANIYAPVTLTGAVNVVNNSASPFGQGWDMPGVMHLYTNSASGVPAGMLLTPGDGSGWYFTQGSGSSYTSPAGPYAFSTLTSVSGGYQLVDQHGTTFDFNSSGFLTSRVERTTATTTYGWTSGNLTSITDPFNRSLGLAYTSNKLTGVTDYAGNAWTLGYTSGQLTSITDPNPGGGAPVWTYGYTGNYLTSVEDPMAATTSFTYDSYHRESGASLPGGASTSATSEQSMGYGGTTVGSAPNVMLASAVDTSTTDALSHTSTETTDYFGNLTSFTNANGQTTTWARDANGLVTTLTQPAPTTGGTQPVTTYSHDSLGNETSASGALDSFGTWTFNSFSEPTSFVNSLSDTESWSFDSHGSLTSHTDFLGNVTSFTVDSFGMPLTMVQPKPNNATGTITTSEAYDTKERLVTTTFPDTSTQTFTYTTDDQLASATDENGHTTSYAHDVLSRLTSVEDALNNTVAYTYDKDNDLLTTTDQMGNVTTDAYNSRNELTSVTLPVPATGVSAPVWTYTYDANGDKLTQVDPLGNTESWAYTNLGQVSSVTLPVPATGISAPVTSSTYDNLGREVTSTNSLSGVTTTAYNSHNWVTSITAPNPGGGAPETEFGYDAIGEQTTISDAMGHVQTTAFTADGQVASVTDNLSHATSYTYGHDGELLTTSDALSHTTTDSYNNRLWLVSTTDANSGTTSVGFDAHGNRTSLTDSVGNEDQYTFSATNQVHTDTNQLGYAITYVYNASGDLTQETDRNGLVRDFTYDNDHRETAEKWMNGSTVVNTIAFAYNADNMVTSASDPDSSYAYAYNNLGEVTSLDNASTPNMPHVVLASTYDAMGDRTQLTATVAGTADFLNAFTYDADQNMLSATQEGQTGGNGVAPKGVGYSFNLDGQITSVLDFDPTTSSPHPDIAYGTLSYDSGNRLTQIDYTHSGSTLDDMSWAYDAGNRVISFTSSVDGTASYSYDSVNEVTAASYTGTNQPANESNSFDKNGNVTNTGYTTGTNNQLTTDGTFNYTYDHEGNRVSRTRISSGAASDYLTTYTWDYRNRLTDVNYYNNSSVLTKHIHYVYDVFDHLIGTEIDATGSGTYSSSEWYALDLAADPNAPAQPVLQFDSSGNETYRYLDAPGANGVITVMAEEAITTQGSAGTTVYVLADNLGSVRDLVSTASVVVDHIVYASRGVVAYESNTAVHHFDGFAGYHDDVFTGVDDADHRWYDPAVIRWESEDPLGFGGGDTNVSRYVMNDSNNAVDPTGLITIGVGVSASGYTGIGPHGEVGVAVVVGIDPTQFGWKFWKMLSVGISGTAALGMGVGVGASAGGQVTVTAQNRVGGTAGLGGQVGVDVGVGGADIINTGAGIDGVSVTGPGPGCAVGAHVDGTATVVVPIVP